MFCLTDDGELLLPYKPNRIDIKSSLSLHHIFHPDRGPSCIVPQPMGTGAKRRLIERANAVLAQARVRAMLQQLSIEA